MALVDILLLISFFCFVVIIFNSSKSDKETKVDHKESLKDRQDLIDVLKVKNMYLEKQVDMLSKLVKPENKPDEYSILLNLKKTNPEEIVYEDDNGREYTAKEMIEFILTETLLGNEYCMSVTKKS